MGVGTVCRRQHTDEAFELIERLHGDYGLRIHGFGLKMAAAAGVSDLLTSADSMAWSYNARLHPKLDTCTHRAKSCANCWAWALRWRTRLLERTLEAPEHRQGRLGFR